MLSTDIEQEHDVKGVETSGKRNRKKTVTLIMKSHNLVDDILNQAKSGQVPNAIDVHDIQIPAVKDTLPDQLAQTPNHVEASPIMRHNRVKPHEMKGQNARKPSMFAVFFKPEEKKPKINIGAPVPGSFKHVQKAGLIRSDTMQVRSPQKQSIAMAALNRSSTMSLNSSKTSLDTKNASASTLPRKKDNFFVQFIKKLSFKKQANEPLTDKKAEYKKIIQAYHVSTTN